MAFPLIPPRSQWVDNNGDPLVSGTLEFLDPTTGLQKATYPTADDADAQTNANNNPISLDADGAATVFLRDGETYRVILKDASGGNVWTIDDVAAPSTSSYPTSASELAAGVTVTAGGFYYGDAKRYGAVIDGTNDDTAAFQAAVDSGHPAFCSFPGTTNIEGTVSLDGDKSLALNAGLNFERQSGASTAPMLHLYGDKNVFDPKGATIRQDLYAHPDGIIRIGPAAGETELGTTDVTCYGNQVSSHFKMLGSWGVGGQDGSVGLYIESIRRKSFTVTNPTYDTHIMSGEILNCDIGVVTSTDVNRSDLKLRIRQFGTAAFISNASYGNHFDLRIETPQPISPEVWREAIHLGTQNYLSTESGTTGYNLITACWNNQYNVYVELDGSGDRKCRVLNWNEPGTTENEGWNTFEIIGQFGGGIGEDGTTDTTGISSNVVRSTVSHVSHVRPIRYHDFHFRQLDDESGSYQRRDSWGLLTGRETGIAEGADVDIFEIDNIGTTRAALMIKIMINAKSGSNNVATVGEQIWAFELESSPSYAASKIADFTTTFGGSNPAVTVTGIAAAGTVASTMKVTMRVTGGNPSGSNTFTCAWKAEYLHSNLVGTNFDPDADITYDP